MFSRNFFKAMFVLWLTFNLFDIFAQSAPFWVTHLTVNNPNQYYFGIGVSTESQKAADDDARGEFSKNVSVKVQSVTDSYLEDSGQEITDSFKRRLKVESGLDLRGINITQRYFAENSKTYYSLIQYEKDEYLALFKEELKREVDHLRQENLTKEQKEKEKIRHQQEMARLKVEKEQKEIALQRERDRIEAEKLRAKKRHLEHLRITRGDFIRMPAPLQVLTFPTAEIGQKKQRISVTPSLNPLGMLRADYTFYWKVLAVHFKVSKKEKFFNWQEFAIKLRLLTGQIDVYKTTLALGAVQFSHDLNSFSDFNHKHIGYSVFLAANISVPQAYAYASVYAERRKAGLGLYYYPFFKGLQGKLLLLLQGEYIFDQNFRNRFADQWLLQPAIRFAVIPGFFEATVSYEQNEYFALGLRFSL